MEYIVAALYKFVSLPDFRALQSPILNKCSQEGVQGTLLLAPEGINGTIAGTRQGIDNVLAFLKLDSRFSDLDHKESFAKEKPFLRMKVRLKKEIVTLGLPNINPTQKVGKYINPNEWNSIITDPEVITIDVRNDYEVDIGSFKEAINPHTKTFREFPSFVKQNLDPKKHTKIAMYCTGGIRCEKSTAYLLNEGFETVYHLKGGILKYLEEIPKEESLWQGDCFVFDDRISVRHGLEEGTYDQCHGCRHPITETDKTSSQYQRGVSCPRCYDTLTEKAKQSNQQRQLQIDLAKQRGTQHLGISQRRGPKNKLKGGSCNVVV